MLLSDLFSCARVALYLRRRRYRPSVAFWCHRRRSRPLKKALILGYFRFVTARVVQLLPRRSIISTRNF